MVAPAVSGDASARPVPVALTGRQPGAIAHALEALEAVAQLGAGVTAQQISQRLGLSPATTYRLLNLLVAEEYIVRLPDLSGFALGRRALEFAGIAAPPQVTLSRGARRTLARVRGELRWGVHLAVYANGRAHIVDADPDHPPPHDGPSDHDFELSAVGRLLTSPSGDDLAVDRGDIDRSIACVAAAIRDENGVLLASLVVIGPSGRLLDIEADLVERLAAAAAELSDLLA